MYIKKIVIEGFKSYGVRTVIGPFHPGHNIIVGYNGSGKSNFFAAIQFVLSDDFTRLQTAQRHALLHEGSGPRSITASVEIIFDNSDKRISVDKNEVSLKRVIGAKKDQYILNKNVVTRSEVVSLMEVAGFSRSNPYYIVRQGKVNEVAMTSESRLILLQEIAGVKVYEDKRNESLAILNETCLKTRSIEELLETINAKLEILKEETKELKEYQQWDKKTRTIEYIIYENELSSNKNKLENFKEQHAKLKIEQAHLKSVVEKFLDKIKNINHDLKRTARDAKTAEEEKENLRKELEKLLTDRELQSLKINGLQQDIKQDNENEESINKELEKLNEKIEGAQAKLGTIKPQYDDVVKETEDIIRELDAQEQERQILYAKQGRSAQFQNKEERNAWINKELTAINKQIDEKMVHIDNLDKDIIETDKKFSELKKTKLSFFSEMERQYSSIYKFKKQSIDFNMEKENNLAKRKDFYREEKALQKDLSYLEEDLKRVDQHLISMSGKDIFHGINSVNKVLKAFRERSDMLNEIHQYHGLVIQHFTCQDTLYKAVEVTGGTRLFHHIVETTKFGGAILKEINRQGLPGVVNFMPLDRLRSRNYTYPSGLENAVPLMSKLNYENMYEIPISFIFGKIIVTRDLKTATEIASNYRFDCVTLEGDQAYSKGWLNGGHFGTSKSVMKMQENKQNLTGEIDSKRRRLVGLSEQIRNIDNKITSSMNNFQQADAKCNKARETYDKLTNDLNNIKEEIEIVENNMVIQKKSLQELESDLNNLKALKENLENELEQDLNDHLTADEQRQIEKLNDSITKFKKGLKNLFKTRESIEKEKVVLENLLNKHLYCKKDELERKLREISVEIKQLSLKASENKYESIKSKIKICREDLKKNEMYYKEVEKENQDKLEKMEQIYGYLKPEQEKFEIKSKELEKLFCNIKILEENIENTKKRMIELGFISITSLKSRYSKMSIINLYKELDNCRKNLKNYEHVNKKALDQYDIFKDLKDNSFKRKEELDRARDKIQQLFEFLQQKKYEAVELTFKQVSKYFAEIFGRIVPEGNAQLIMERGTSRKESDSSSTNSVDWDNIVGIGLRVSFTGQTTAMRDYNQLSGGEKSLVALTLIFAIQKCDPAPFYLFDEIDQALDTAHRRAVAQMIHELSSEAQFIITTFRPELLEHANQFYGVRFQKNISSIHNVSREEALEFVEQDGAG